MLSETPINETLRVKLCVTLPVRLAVRLGSKFGGKALPHQTLWTILAVLISSTDSETVMIAFEIARALIECAARLQIRGRDRH